MVERPQLLALATEIYPPMSGTTPSQPISYHGLSSRSSTRWLPPNRQLLRHQRQNPL
jgi:hypothetical protein